MKRLILYSLMNFCMIGALHAQAALSADDYKAKVLSYNQDVKSAQQTVEAAKSAAHEIKTGYFPEVNGVASYSYNFNPPALAFGNVNTELRPSNWSAGGQLMQYIYTGGRLSASYNAAKIQLDISALMEQLSIDNIGYTAEISYWNAAAAKAYVDATAHYQQILKKLYDLVQARFDDGLISKTDVLKIATGLKDADYQVSRAQQAFGNHCIILNLLMGEVAQAPLLLADFLSEPNPAIDLISDEELLERRPDYLAKSKEIDFQKQKEKLDQSGYLPSFYIGGSVNYGTPLLNLDDRTMWTPQVYAGLSVPIFHWGKSKHSRDRNKALYTIKELAQSAVADKIKKEWSTALNNMEETEKQIGIAKESLDLAKQSLDLHTFSYEEGRISILDVQSAQLAWLQAYLSLIDSFLGNKLAYASYRKTISE